MAPSAYVYTSLRHAPYKQADPVRCSDPVAKAVQTRQHAATHSRSTAHRLELAYTAISLTISAGFACLSYRGGMVSDTLLWAGKAVKIVKGYAASAVPQLHRGIGILGLPAC